MLEKREFEQSDFLYRLSLAVTVVSGFFSLIVFLLLVVNYMQIRAADPVNNEMITKMRQEYAALPEEDPALAQRIRDLDLLTRKAFFTTQTHLRVGAVMLLVGVSLFLIAFKYMMRWKRDLPKLAETPTAEKEFLAFAQSRQLIAWGGVGLLGVGMMTALLTEGAIYSTVDARILEAPPAATSAQNAATEAQAAASPEGIAKAIETPAWEAMELNWPTFRGPGSTGVAHFTSAPTQWDLAAGTGVKWKTETQLPGHNSPVVWENRLYFSGANETTREVYCYDTESGELVWKKTLDRFQGTPAEPPKVNEEAGFAAPSMAVHGKQVFAIFANGDLASYTAEGEFVWGLNIGLPDNHYGHASSLLAYGNLLYVQRDDNSKARLLAFDLATGKEAWEAERKTISWASPILARTSFGPQLILNSEATVDGYAPDTGKLLWSQECLGGEVAPSPAYGNGVVFAANEYATASLIKLNGTAEAIQPEIAWQYDSFLPEVSSPVLDGERVYFATSAGQLVALDTKAGTELWVEELAESFYSSPVLVGDKVFILGTEGKMYIVQAGSDFALLATLNVGEGTFATPAYLDGKIYLRSTGHLYCIESSHG
ncbi:MAG: PQQ-binding-like beta-propeller repeat protein [Candidatus Hydrogenedentes bacterium]|nr:PQQ-binding-like beta-propeller repeat protein [Candidatus Hydrogenedentota bacterium]MBI3117976.1 PQQ-binding-like beta-propeller repeat protein [Candidatus Hydrogenedentota bacterium]